MCEEKHGLSLLKRATSWLGLTRNVRPPPHAEARAGRTHVILHFPGLLSTKSWQGKVSLRTPGKLDERVVTRPL